MAADLRGARPAVMRILTTKQTILRPTGIFLTGTVLLHIGRCLAVLQINMLLLINFKDIWLEMLESAFSFFIITSIQV